MIILGLKSIPRRFSSMLDEAGSKNVLWSLGMIASNQIMLRV